MRKLLVATSTLLIASVISAAPPQGVHWRLETLRTLYAPPQGFYCYAPGVIREGTTDHIFACRNTSPGVIRDHLYYFCSDTSGAPLSAPTLALSPNTDGTWDSFHICDPSALAGQFRWGDVTYRYALFFLGNNVDASQNNQVGVAFANDLAGPWRRMPQPLIPDRPGIWGTGQPSAISLDRAGKALLFYTRSNPSTAGWVREINLSDVDHPVIGPETQLSTAGLTRSDGRPDSLNNFDVAYGEPNARIIAIRERHPHPKTEPTFIGDTVQLASMPLADLRNPAATWTVLGNLTPAITHVARNHNAGLVRDSFGRLPDLGRVRVVFSSSAAEPELHGLFAPFTYALHQIEGDLGPPAMSDADGH